jgi:hypothetical protein
MASGRQGHFINRTDGAPGKPVVAGPSLSRLPPLEDDINCFKRIHLFNNKKTTTEVHIVQSIGTGIPLGGGDLMVGVTIECRKVVSNNVTYAVGLTQGMSRSPL